MVKLEITYTEQAGRFYKAYVSVNNKRIHTIYWLHELNDTLSQWGLEFPASYDDGAYQMFQKAKQILPFTIDVNDLMDVS